MAAFQPVFKCEFCDKEIPTLLTNATQGQVGACGCSKARAHWESIHRAEMERRKRSRGKRRA